VLFHWNLILHWNLFSSWLNIFNTLRPMKKPVKKLPPVAQARENYIRPSVEQLLEAMNKSVTFIVGRNPLERLVSGYRDKILNAVSRSVHEKLGRVISKSKCFGHKLTVRVPFASMSWHNLKIEKLLVSHFFNCLKAFQKWQHYAWRLEELKTLGWQLNICLWIIDIN